MHNGSRMAVSVSLFFVLASFLPTPSHAKCNRSGSLPELEITIDHETGTRSPSSTIQMCDGQRVKIIVKNTRIQCFDFGQTEEKAPGGTKLESFNPGIRDTITWNFEHDPEVAAYTIEARRKPAAPSECNSLPMTPQSWRIPVKTFGWSLAFAGAFTGDTLTDQVFSLEPGKNPNDPTQTGFLVRSNTKAEDKYKLGTAAMIHVYHSDPEQGLIGDVKWAPISFGLGVNQGSEVRYFLGTSLKFGDQLFLTGGLVLGSRKRLPNALTEGGFTTDNNALSSLPSQTDHGVFIGVSYSFLGSTARDVFTRSFNSNPPAQPNVQSTGGQKPQASEKALTYDPQPKQGSPKFFEVTEGTPLAFSLKLAGTSDSPIKFKLISKNGTAKDGQDFTALVKEEYEVSSSKPKVDFQIPTLKNPASQGDRDFTLEVQELPDTVSMTDKIIRVVIKKSGGQ